MSKSILSFSLIAVLVAIVLAVPASAGDLRVVIDEQGNTAIVDGSINLAKNVRKLQAVVADNRAVSSDLQRQVNELNGKLSDEALTEKINSLLQNRGVDTSTPAGQKAADIVRNQAKAGTLDVKGLKDVVAKANRAERKANASLILSLVALLLGLIALLRSNVAIGLAERARGYAQYVETGVRNLGTSVQRVFGDAEHEGLNGRAFPDARLLFNNSRMADWLDRPVPAEEEETPGGNTLDLNLDDEEEVPGAEGTPPPPAAPTAETADDGEEGTPPPPAAPPTES